MRLLHVIPSVALIDGGPSEAAIWLSRALRIEGEEILIAATNASGSNHLEVPLETPTEYRGAPAIFFRRTASVAYKYSASLARWLQENVSSFDLVLVSSVFSHSSVAAARACARAGIPWVLRPLGHLDPWSLSRSPRRKRIFLATVGRQLVEEAHAFYFTTEEESRLAARALPDPRPRSFCLPLGVDESLFRIGDAGSREGDPPYVLFLSRLEPKKNVESLIRAFASVLASRTTGPRWRLVVAGAGDPDYEGQLRILAHGLGIEDRVDWPGWIGGEAKRNAFRGAALFVLPSHQENFGIAVAEAMASGLPVMISRSVNLAREVEASQAGWVVDEPANLASALEMALADANERRRRAENGRQLALRQFRWSAVARALHREIRDLLQK